MGTQQDHPGRVLAKNVAPESHRVSHPGAQDTFGQTWWEWSLPGAGLPQHKSPTFLSKQMLLVREVLMSKSVLMDAICGPSLAPNSNKTAI